MSNLQAGYKQTEVVVIPEDWEVKSIGTIATIATGNTPPTHDTANYGDVFLFVSPTTWVIQNLSHKQRRCFQRRASLFLGTSRKDQFCLFVLARPSGNVELQRRN